ncbi:MAG: hypothetical protein ACI86H_002290, partial [bacterium]
TLKFVIKSCKTSRTRKKFLKQIKKKIKNKEIQVTHEQLLLFDKRF